MINKFKYFLKVISINFLVLLSLVVVIELFFGYWFEQYNLGPYMREHRMKKVPYSLTYKDVKYDHVYKRNYYGFRGEEIEPKNIEAIFIGGSTADERYKPEEHTIVGNINRKFKETGIKLNLINAGIEGQSSVGHIVNFEAWFPKIKDFRPKYIFFYVGINDTKRIVNETTQDCDSCGHVLNHEALEAFKDNFRSRSILIDKIRKAKHRYYTKQARQIYDFDYSVKNYLKSYTDEEYKYYDFILANTIHNEEELKKKHNLRIESYLSNIRKLKNFSDKMGAKAIFINQVLYDGLKDEVLFILNKSLIELCEKKKYHCIDLAKTFKGKLNYWWDGVHTTREGSREIVDVIFPQIEKIIYN